MKIIETARALEEKSAFIANIKCLVGFDGFIDEIFRVVKTRTGSSEYVPFDTIEEFSEHIRLSAGKSADTEIVSQEIRAGGNAPIMANSLACLGVSTKCIGALGMPEVHDVYTKFSTHCETISIAKPGYTSAYEFSDGKLMFGSISALDEVNWENINKVIGLEAFVEMVDESSLIGIVNWRYLINMKSILIGILEDVFPKIEHERLTRKKIFFDIADPSGRNTEELKEYLNILGLFSEHTEVILGLNEREARLVYSCLYDENISNKEKESDLKDIAKQVFEGLSISTLVVHSTRTAISICKDQVCEEKSFYVENPLTSTGAGDNFNAGFSLGQLLGLTIEQSLITANATSSFYVSKGRSPNFNELLAFIDARTATNCCSE